MDNNMGVMEESRGGSDYVAPESKSLGSLVHINSIAIDIGSAMEEIEPPVHEHFSIRGFVSRMREKDMKMCMPFDDGNLVDDLPPLFVPKSRWWQCADCVPDIGTRSCINVDGEKDCVIIHCTENMGKEDGSRDYEDGEGDDASNRNLMSSKPSCTEGNKDKTEVSDKEAGNIYHDIPEEANPLRIREKHNNVEDAADVARVALCIVGEPDNGSDGTKSALMHRRKPKVRSLVDIMADNRITTSNNSTDQLELDVAADVAKGKQKFVFEEDGGPFVVEKTHGSVEISELEPERDVSVMRLGEMTHHRTKPRKRKALDNSPKMNAVREMGSCMGSSMLEQRIERISHFAKRKRSELVESDRDHLMPPPPSKIVLLGACSNKGKVALDLSLNSFNDSGKASNGSSSGQLTSIIPDLNETFPDAEQGNELPAFSEERSALPCHKTLDVSASCSEEAARKGKRQLTAHELQKPDNHIELGRASVDFPTEIVELLAKNQLARTHERARKQHLIHEPMNSSFQGSHALYFNGINNIPLPNRNTIIRQTIPLNNRQLEESPFRPQYSASREDVFWTKSPFHLSNPRTHMGKTVSDIKGQEGKTAIPVRSLDPYSNEAIPAMQLLSLMDQRNVSSSSFKSFLQKPFAPTNHHPRMNGNEHRNFGPFDSPKRNSKDFMGGWRSGVYCAGESSSKKSSLHSKGQIPQERPARSNSPLGVCTLNRNPADFSVPDARNEFTISARDLKPRKRNADGRKRQRVRKETS